MRTSSTARVDISVAVRPPQPVVLRLARRVRARVPRIVIAAIAGLLAGLAFIASNVIAQHNPLPHQAEIAVAGIDAGRLQEALDRSMPGGYRAVGVSDPSAAVGSVTGHDAVAALVVSGGRVTVLTTSAGGYDAATAVQQALTQAAKALELPPPAPRDIVPLQPGDPRGLSLAQIVLGTILGGLAALVLDPITGVLTGHFLWIWLWLGAAAFAMAEVVRA